MIGLVHGYGLAGSGSNLWTRLGHRARPEVRAGAGEAVAVNESNHCSVVGSVGVEVFRCLAESRVTARRDRIAAGPPTSTAQHYNTVTITKKAPGIARTQKKVHLPGSPALQGVAMPPRGGRSLRPPPRRAAEKMLHPSRSGDGLEKGAPRGFFAVEKRRHGSPGAK